MVGLGGIALNGLEWLLRAAGPQRWERQVASLGGRLSQVARNATVLPVELVDAMAASGRDDLLVALCRPANGWTPALRERLAGTGSAVVAEQVLGGWPLRDRRALFAAARADDPAWRERIAKLLASTEVDQLRAAVVSPFPELVRRVLDSVGAELTAAERLRAEFQLAGGDETALAEAEGTTGAIAELRARPDPEQLGWRPALDWDQILAAHRAEPFGPAAAAVVTARPDCPEAVTMALFATHPVAVAEAARATPALVAAPLPPRSPAQVARRRAENAIRDSLPSDALLRAVPAAAVLEALHRKRVGLDELAPLVAGLGSDVGRWRAVRAELKGFRGSIIELLTNVTSTSAPPTWPDRKTQPDLNERKAPTGVRAAFLALLDAAPTGAHLALLGHLDDRTIHELLSRGRWRDEWVDAAMASPNPALCRALACRRDLDADAAERLVGYDDSAANGQLFRGENLPGPMRSRILSQRPLTPGRAGPVPLDPALREHLTDYTGGNGTSPYHGRDAIDCADGELQRHILQYRLIYGEIPQQRLVLNMWRRHGRAAVEEIIARTDGPATFKGRYLSATTIKRVQRLLAQPEAAALAKLSADVDAGETPQAQIAMLRAASGPTAARLRESHDWHWKAVADEHAARPFPDGIMVALAARPGSPAWFRARFSRAIAVAMGGWRSPAQLLAGDDYNDPWGASRLVHAGQLSWADVFTHARPAGFAFNVLDYVPAGSTAAGVAALSELVAATIDGQPEAWVLVAHMVAGFEGSVAELLFTGAAAAV